MTHRIDTPPDFTRPEVGAAVFVTWRVDPARQREVVDVVGNAWPTHPWPGPHGFDVTLFSGEDGRSLLLYVQTASIDHRPDPPWKDDVDAVVSDVHRVDATAARPYRGTAPPPNAPLPGCYVLTEVTLADPCPGGQHRWVDAVFDPAGTALPPPESGLIAAHFFLTTDCTRVLSLAEWTTAEAHERAGGEPPPTLREATDQHPGVVSVDVNRYLFELRLEPDPEELEPPG